MSIVPGFTFKLQSEIFNDKKSLSTKIFFSTITKNLNWEILTTNLLDNLQILQGDSSVNLLHIFRAPVYENTSCVLHK